MPNFGRWRLEAPSVSHKGRFYVLARRLQSHHRGPRQEHDRRAVSTWEALLNARGRIPLPVNLAAGRFMVGDSSRRTLCARSRHNLWIADDLRAADSFQLAAALEWCEDDPQGRIFLTADRRLREAAWSSGFDANPM